MRACLLPPPRALLASRRRSRSGLALVLVLIMVVLLCGLIVAFFSRAISQRQISDNNANQIRVELLARGAIDTILSDLKREIVTSSTAVSLSSGTLYLPLQPWDAIPSASGTVNALPFPPNLLKLSGTAPVYRTSSGNTGPVRGLDLPATTASLNGRTIPAERWNKPLLLPLQNSGSTLPLVNGTAPGLGPWNLPSVSGTYAGPSWVLVARDGSNPILSGTTLTTAVKWSNSNSTTVVGRYAYAIYDEGGLLDMNVAGYPSSAASANPLEIARKGALAFADLTQLPLTSGSLSQSDVDKLIAWRNAATATSGSAYITAVRSNTNGFLSVAVGSGTQTDRAFISRQSLINFLTSGTLSLSGSAAWPLLQYMGTFSRGLEQPSYAPPVDRPKIVPPAGSEIPINPSLTNSTASDLALLGNYRGGNDGATGDDLINPRFLEIRAASAFQRNDGTAAKVGEPIVLKRFFLNRLAWLTYKGPSASRNMSDRDILALKNAGITEEFLKQGTDTNIKKYFGMTWTTTTPASVRPAYEPPNFWTYDHDIKDTNGKTCIGTLQKVRDANREPDFFELLKAAICAGSLGKASAPESKIAYESGIYYQYRDRQIDPHVIQIGANIIDQFDADSYPTRIVFDNSSTSSSTGNPHVIRGVEDLPYLYRVRLGVVRFKDPDSRATSSPTDITSTISQFAGASFIPGSLVLLAHPEIWAPHNCNPSSSGNPTPTSFRTYAESAPPCDNMLINQTRLNFTVSGRASSVRSYASASGTAAGGITSYTQVVALSGTSNAPDATVSIKGAYFQSALSGTIHVATPATTGTLTASTYQLGSEIFFDCNNSSLFRNPTLLQEKNLPTGTALRAGPGNVLSSGTFNGAVHGTNLELNPSTPSDYVGFVLGELPAAWISYTTGSTATSGNYKIYKATDASIGATNFTVRLQYLDPSGNPVTYNECYLRQSGNPTDMGFSSGTGSPLLRWTCFDPRTSRFGYVAVTQNQTPELFNQSERPGISISSGAGGANGLAGRSLPGSLYGDLTGFYNNSSYYDLWHKIGWYLPGPTTDSTPQAVRPGDFSQNVLNFGGGCQYYSDADDIVRRAVGAYASGTDGHGLPMVNGNTSSRPIILNRPFRSVAELGYVFKGTPWKNLDFFTPETGDAALLDVFCINEPQKPMVAGKVNLDTRQAPVLQAILAKALKNEFDSAATDAISTDAAAIANTVVARTTSAVISKGPFANVSEVAGRLVGKSVTGTGSEAYIPPADRNGNVWTYSSLSAELTGTSAAYGNTSDPKIQRRAETAIRALSDAGQTRVWNLLIDIVSQTGKYPESSTRPDQFLVQGEKRYWFHVAIDRLTGQILDSALEPVSE